MKKILVTFTLTLLLASHTTSAQPPTQPLISINTQPYTLFGLTLGQPFTLPWCEAIGNYGLDRACYIPDKKIPPATAFVHIVLPESQRPEHADRNILMAELFQNQLQALSFLTPGDLPSQQAIIEQMTRQFGTPQSASIVTAQDHQNGDYLQFEIGSHQATWRIEELQILYSGAYVSVAGFAPLGFLHFSLKPAD